MVYGIFNLKPLAGSHQLSAVMVWIGFKESLCQQSMQTAVFHPSDFHSNTIFQNWCSIQLLNHCKLVGIYHLFGNMDAWVRVGWGTAYQLRELVQVITDRRPHLSSFLELPALPSDQLLVTPVHWMAFTTLSVFILSCCCIQLKSDLII